MTVEAALVFTALALITGAIVAGVNTAASYLVTVDLARDAARAAALEPDTARAAVDAVVSSAHAPVEADVDAEVNADVDGQLITVRLTRQAKLFDFTVTSVIIAEPPGEGATFEYSEPKGGATGQ